MKSRAINRETIKNRIIQAAVSEFSKKGFINARIDSIASYTGINPSRIYYYIGNKENLYCHVLTYVFETVADNLLQPLFSLIEELEYEPDMKLALLIYSMAISNNFTPVRYLRRINSHDYIDGRNSTQKYMSKYLDKYFYSTEKFLKEGISTGRFEISDTSMFILNICSIRKTGTTYNQNSLLPGSESKQYLEIPYNHSREFVFKSLAPAGKTIAIPEPDDDKKMMFKTLIHSIQMHK